MTSGGELHVRRFAGARVVDRLLRAQTVKRSDCTRQDEDDPFH
jgi:hypothetical protein